MKFNVSVKGSNASAKEEIEINFSMKLEADGSVGIFIDNNSTRYGPQRFLRINPDGTVTRMAFSGPWSGTSYLKYEQEFSPRYNGVWEVVKVVNE
jgi:hypothetical protein